MLCKTFQHFSIVICIFDRVLSKLRDLENYELNHSGEKYINI